MEEGEKRATVIASVLELGSTTSTSYYLLCIVYLLFPQQFEWLVSSATTSILSTFSNGNFDLNWKMLKKYTMHCKNLGCNKALSSRILVDDSALS